MYDLGPRPCVFIFEFTDLSIARAFVNYCSPFRLPVHLCSLLFLINMRMSSESSRAALLPEPSSYDRNAWCKKRDLPRACSKALRELRNASLRIAALRLYTYGSFLVELKYAHHARVRLVFFIAEYITFKF